MSDINKLVEEALKYDVKHAKPIPNNYRYDTNKSGEGWRPPTSVEKTVDKVRDTAKSSKVAIGNISSKVLSKIKK